MVDTSTSPNSAAAGGGTIIDDLHGFLRHGLHTHSSVLYAHAFLFCCGLLLGHPVPAGLLIASACSAASPPAHILRLIRHLPPPLPLFSLDAALRALGPRIPFSALLSLFAALLRSHHPLFPDHFSFPPLLSAAASATSPRLHFRSALALHGQLLRRGLLFSSPPHAANALFHFYATAGGILSARYLFDEMPFRDIASCNTLMTALARTPGGLDVARQVFEGMHLRNVVSWNVMINGYVKANQPDNLCVFAPFLRMITCSGSHIMC
ncbi:Pentatricopeptide repeat-containing protein ELI1, chloroplastic [Zea mays]|jgi:hypothetical protein|uniref:Pentatricopeptide repeat-containing protein ELI1, chloroplastic n=1 Tax=Zea mays TaxID=4577 RepID=A0A3L6DCU3_MAIZE|nr:Pentatricopeptide repeat-containing protein ELI1, chloroplastic [Zea mays]